MKTLTASDIISKVRSCLDEFEWNDTPLFDEEEDELNMDKNILSKVVDALTFIYQNCSDEDLDGAGVDLDTTGTGVFSIDSDTLVGHVKLPKDLMRVISVKLSSWKRAPQMIITENSELYKMQQDKYTCGTWERPVAAIVSVSTGRELELYSARTASDTLKYCMYIPVPGDLGTSEGESVSIPDRLVPAFIYQVAALVLTSYKDQLASTYFALAKERIGIEQIQSSQS